MNFLKGLVKMQLTIKDVVSNLIDALTAEHNLLSKHELLEMAKNSQFKDEAAAAYELGAKVLYEQLPYILERIDMAMLMSAAVGDVALPTIGKIYEAEAPYDFPLSEDGFIDTEEVYNTIDDVVKDIKDGLSDW